MFTFNSSNFFVGYIFSLFCLVLTFQACDNSIDAFDEEGGVGTFSVYGALDFSKEINVIRVQDISNPLLADSVAELDVDVTLINVDTQAAEILEDSVVFFDDIATHNFPVMMDITPETSYRLQVQDPEGVTQNFEATTPADAEVTVSPEEGYTCNTVIRITFDPVRSNELLQAEFRFNFRNVDIFVEADVQQGGDVARIVFQPSEIVFRGIATAAACESVLGDLELEYTHIGPGFEEIMNDFVGLGTEQFVGLFQDDITFMIRQP